MNKVSKTVLTFLLLAVSTEIIVAQTRIVNCDAPVQSRKRGIPSNYLSPEDFRALAPGASWYYNWGIGALAKPADVTMDYLPMVYNGSSANQSALSSYLSAGNRPWRVLGLNEPNYTGEADMTPQQCATSVSQMRALCDPYGIPVVAPQVTIGTDPSMSITAYDPIQNATVTYTYQEPYLQAFMYYCGSTQPASLSVHSYGGYGELTWITGTMHTDFPTQNIWVTEFNQSGATSSAGAINTLIADVDYCERTPWIEGYAWFMSRVGGDPYNSLLDANLPGVLTPTGQAYTQMPVHDSNLYYRIPGRLQAERYVTFTNMDIGPTTDVDGLADMFATAASGSINYNLQVDTAGTYPVYIRVYGTGTISLYSGSTLLGSATSTQSGWSTINTGLALSTGTQTLRAVVGTSAQRLNWMEFLPIGGAPITPTGVAASSQNTQVTLSWNACTTATSYNVKRSTTSGGPYTTVASPTTTSYVNTGLTNGQTYFYVISAVNGSGAGANSAEVSALPSPVIIGANLGFETPSIGSANYVPTPQAASWNFTANSGNAGISSNGSGYTSGNPNAPEGTQVAVLSANASMSQRLSGFVAGATYSITFSAAQRANWGGTESFAVQIDGTTVKSYASVPTAYANYSFSFTASAASHTLSFVGTTTGDNTVLIDNVRVLASPTVLNSGFETPSVSASPYYVASPSSASWTFTANSGNVGISSNGSAFTSGNSAAPEGTQVAVLGANASIAQTVSGLVPGASYTVSFSAAQRANWGGTESFAVKIDGTAIKSFASVTTAYVVYTTTFTASATSHVLSFVGTTTGDNTVFIDNVQVLANPPPPLVANSGFETPATTSYLLSPTGASWTFTANAWNAGVSANGSGYTSGNGVAPGGTQVALLQGNASITQALSGFTPGRSYTITFSAAQRANWGGTESFAVQIDGTTKGSFASVTSTYTTYSVSFTATAATHTLGFVGTTTGDNTVFLDNVRITTP